jgi:hypothetical protein
MKRSRRAILAAVVVGAVLAGAPAVARAAAPGDDGTVIFNEDYQLSEGDVQQGDVIVFNGDLDLRADSRVEGTVVVWNGDATVEGTITGDLVVSGGTITLGQEAMVAGNVVCSWGCDLVQEEGAQIGGEAVQGLMVEVLGTEWLRDLSIRFPTAVPFQASGGLNVVGYILGVLRTAFGVLVVTILAALVRAMWPDQTSRVCAAIVREPVAAAGFGLLTAIVGGAGIAVLAITICLSLFALLGGLALVAAGLLGWGCLGAIVGERLLAALNVDNVAPPWAAALGTFLISVLSAGGSVLPVIGCCLGAGGWLVSLIAGSVGLGAVVVTRFGTTEYPAAP